MDYPQILEYILLPMCQQILCLRTILPSQLLSPQRDQKDIMTGDSETQSWATMVHLTLPNFTNLAFVQPTGTLKADARGIRTDKDNGVDRYKSVRQWKAKSTCCEGQYAMEYRFQGQWKKVAKVSVTILYYIGSHRNTSRDTL
jgi:hypothetical protein